MKTPYFLFAAGLAVAGLLTSQGGIQPDLANNLAKPYFGADTLSETEWDAQAFNSGLATQLLTVTLNLFRQANATGTYWVRLYDQSGPNQQPGTNLVATLASGCRIEELSSSSDHTITLSPAVALVPGHEYYIVVGTDPGAWGLHWGYTNDPVGAMGFPSRFCFTPDGGLTWRLNWTPLPQRMRVRGDTGS
jgi:hypothetical protein